MDDFRRPLIDFDSGKGQGEPENSQAGFWKEKKSNPV
jgi:hypothetical protein